MSSSTNYHHSVALFDELASVRSLFAVCPLCDCPAVCDAAEASKDKATKAWEASQNARVGAEPAKRGARRAEKYAAAVVEALVG